MTEVTGLPVNMIGVVFAFNTFVIVVAQVWVLKRMEGRSRWPWDPWRRGRSCSA
jgi:hypothetical protein